MKNDSRINELLIFQTAANLDNRGNTHKVWIEGNHPILVEEGYMFKEKLIYIHNNPVRKGYITEPEHWIYSSARNYILGDQSVLQIECIE